MFLHTALPRGWADHESHPSSLTGLSALPSPHLGTSMPSLESGGRAPVRFLSLCSSVSPNKALPEFFIWPFINFYWFRRPRTLAADRLGKAEMEPESLYLLQVPFYWCFWTVMPKKTLESPLDCKEIQSVHPKGNQSWIFIGRTEAEAEAPIIWPHDAKSWPIGKDPDAGKDWTYIQLHNMPTTREVVCLLISLTLEKWRHVNLSPRSSSF